MKDKIMSLDVEKIQDLLDIEREDGCLFNHIFKLFEIDCKNTLQSIPELVKTHNHEELFHAIHYLKGSCVNIGAIESGQICSIICRDIEKQNTIGIEQVEDLEYALWEDIKELKTFLNQ